MVFLIWTIWAVIGREMSGLISRLMIYHIFFNIMCSGHRHGRYGVIFWLFLRNMLQGLERLEYFHFLEEHWYNNVSFFVNIFISCFVFDLNFFHPKLGIGPKSKFKPRYLWRRSTGDPNNQYNSSPFHKKRITRPNTIYYIHVM